MIYGRNYDRRAVLSYCHAQFVERSWSVTRRFCEDLRQAKAPSQLPSFAGCRARSIEEQQGADEEVLLLTQCYRLGTRGLTGVSLAPVECGRTRGEEESTTVGDLSNTELRSR